MSEDADLEKMLYLNAMKATLKVLNELEAKNFNKKNDVTISDIEKKKKNDITCKTRVFKKRRNKENPSTGNESRTDVVGSKNSSKKKNDDEKPIEKVKRLKKENGVDERAQAPGRKRSTDHPRIERRKNEDMSNIKSMTKRSQMYSKDDNSKRSSFRKKTVEIDRKSKSSRIDRRKMDKKMRR
ncbi:hypothetical protein THOM_2025 [Trachipleistophora hominis]|uniref:Uncharacterized protein n=1 Tax=Trachipleistophora hominis TaxID=72359 RepID=L7JUQ1_TRAHO|nr:hypothetical protein THOM_2025 [Trachipleistophora hominis]